MISLAKWVVPSTLHGWGLYQKCFSGFLKPSWKWATHELKSMNSQTKSLETDYSITVVYSCNSIVSLTNARVSLTCFLMNVCTQHSQDLQEASAWRSGGCWVGEEWCRAAAASEQVWRRTQRRGWTASRWLPASPNWPAPRTHLQHKNNLFNILSRVSCEACQLGNYNLDLEMIQ